MNETLRRLTTLIFNFFFVLCSSVYLSICTQTFPFTNILHSCFVEQLAYISPFTVPSSICKCDKPLEPLSTCPAYFSAALFTFSYVSKPSHSQISFIHILLIN